MYKMIFDGLHNLHKICAKKAFEEGRGEETITQEEIEKLKKTHEADC